jgi:hypothetical protein
VENKKPNLGQLTQMYLSAHLILTSDFHPAHGLHKEWCNPFFKENPLENSPLLRATIKPAR